MTMSARENLTLPNLKPFWKGGIVRRKAEKARTKEWFERLSVRPANGIEEPLSIFSGGNQQKILFGKWLSHGAIRLPPRRADPGSGRRRQGRPPS